jgi:hypothetical protein
LIKHEVGILEMDRVNLFGAMELADQEEDDGKINLEDEGKMALSDDLVDRIKEMKGEKEKKK